MLRQLRELVSAAVGLDEVTGNRRIVDDAFQFQSAGAQGLEGGLEAVHHLGRFRVAQPRRQDVFGFGILAGKVDVYRGSVPDDCQRGGILADASGNEVDGDGGPLSGARGEECAQLSCSGGCAVIRDVEALPLGEVHVFGAVEGKEPGADGLELQLVEQLFQRRLVRPGVGEVVQGHGKLEVGVEPVQPAVPLHGVHVFAEGVAHLAADLVEVFQHAFQAAVEVDPLGGRLGTNAGHAGKVVRRLAHQGGQVRILGGADKVLFLDGGGIQAGNVADALPGVKHKDVLRNQLEGVAVARHQQHFVARLFPHGGERGQDVIRFVAGHLDGLDAPRPHDLVNEVDLAAHLTGCFVSAALVLAVLGLPVGGLVRDVERHRDVRGLLFLDQVDEHGRKTVDRVGVLPRGGGKLVSGQREERPEGHRVPVQHQEAGLVGDGNHGCLGGGNRLRGACGFPGGYGCSR
ncbi:hypothetical protein D9M72_349440 [compost metagenome]